MSVAAVTGVAPKFVSGANSQPYLIRNNGQSTVYLGSSSSLSPATRDITLSAGSSLQWPSGSELWAICDPGFVSELEWLYTAGASFTPGPSTVTAKLANIPVSLGSSYVVSQPLVRATGAYYFETPSYDVSGFASVFARVYVVGNPSPTLLGGNYMRLSIEQSDTNRPVGGVLGGSDLTNNCQFLIGRTGYDSAADVVKEMTYQCAIGRKYARAALSVLVGTDLGASYNIFVELFGTNDPSPAPKYVNNPFGSAGSAAFGGMFFTAVNPGAANFFPNHKNGLIQNYVENLTGSGETNGTIFFLESGVLMRLNSIRATSTESFRTRGESLAPCLPMRVTVAASASVSGEYSFSQ